jgi:hypothetical protein
VTTWPYAQSIKACTNYAVVLDTLNNLITIEEHSNRHAAHPSQAHNIRIDEDYDIDTNINHVNFQDVPPTLQIQSDLRNLLSRDTIRKIGGKLYK